MKLIYPLTTLLLSLAACETINKNETKINDETKINSAIDTIIVSKKQTFHVQGKVIGDDQVQLSATDGDQPALEDTISGPGLLPLEFPDFNADGFLDILLKYADKSSTAYLYLFDPRSNTFKSIDGFVNYPNAVRLHTNPAYYYAYYSEGCSDLNWISDLFKIDSFKTIQIGHIYGKGCEYNVLENPQLIGIYKTTGDNGQSEILVEKLPYLKFIPTNNEKRDFLEKYWNNNYYKFE
ncbi:hypothetical protein [Flavihumibacter fluvii]|uniref:hypothetical protein n=1 Tax=Flavihumibacter fluvii TaxID=2838157 RepID=UPI001BDF0371|nr:hypothetical protein [Flavihumibacter fluvii]ULQ54713.1 hypothetical protein KJS93_10325 [Flavihumibacter fluvii]